MSDAYGTITFSKSNDCIIDSSSLIQELNRFNWSNDVANWFYSESNDTLKIAPSHLQYPVAIPEFDEFIHVRNDDGTLATYNVSEVNDSILDQMFGSTSAPFSLKELSRRISPHIKKGWVEIACCANQKSRYVYFQSLRICSNGTAIKRNSWSGPCIDPVNEHESYEPQ